ncbi:MAG TPA: ornithine cyclodeaminase family protein, partial [Chloroflexota bacterium]|nr:ornithine cyclodeaminase family protein [Chloroflexota bacterium]
MLYLSNADVQSVLDMATCLDALRAGYRDLARGDAAYVPRIDLWAPTGGDDDYYCFGSMTGVSRSAGVVAVRIKSDVITWSDGGKTTEKYCVQPGTYSGIILLYSIRNGEPLALM